MKFDVNDYYLGLIFYSRPLQRMIAVELNVSKHISSYKGQMGFFKWLKCDVRRKDENAPISLFLCTESSREQIELLEMHKGGILAAENWTVLPLKSELEAKIRAIYRDTPERLAVGKNDDCE